MTTRNREEFIRYYLIKHIPKIVRRVCYKFGVENYEARRILEDRLVMSFAAGLSGREGANEELMNKRLLRDLLNPKERRGTIFLLREERLPTLTELDLKPGDVEGKGPSVAGPCEAKDILLEAYGVLDKKTRALVDDRYGIEKGYFHRNPAATVAEKAGLSHQRVFVLLENKFHARVRKLCGET